MSDSVLITDLFRLKKSGTPIVALTAYDYPFARLADLARADLILVGDSVGTVVQGNKTTIPVTLDQMVYHSQLVTRAVTRALVVADLPFLSYQVSADEAVAAAGRLMKEGGAGAVKLEGGSHRVEAVRRLIQEGIPVMGHIGLLPQSYHATGGYRVQGRTVEQQLKIKSDALALAEAGVFSIVLEGMPAQLASEITSAIPVPTIGIGAGRHCSGQILVLHDLLGLSGDPESNNLPRFVKQYADLDNTVSEALLRFAADVRSGQFPGPDQSYE